MPTQLRPLSTGQLLDRTFQVYRQNFTTFAGISAIPHIVLLVGQIAFVATVGAAAANGRGTAQNILLATSMTFLIAVLSVIVDAVATAATTYAVSDLYLENPTSISSCFGRVKGKIGKVVYVSVEYSVRVGLGFILFLIPGIYFAGKYGLAVPAAVLEDVKGRLACARSSELTKDSVGRIVVIYFLTWILVVVISAGFGFGLEAVAPSLAKAAGTVTSTIVTYILSAIVNTVITPVMAVALTLAYYDQRVRKEAFDIENMMSLLGEPVPAAPQNSLGASSLG